MKKTLLAVFVCLFLALVLSMPAALAQDDAKGATAAVVSYWKKGDTRRLAVRMDKGKDINGRQTSETVVYDVTMRVLDESDEGYTVEWTYENSSARGGNPLAERLYKMSNGLRVVYRTDETGVFTGLVNWQEVQAHLFKALDMVEKGAGVDQAAAKAVVGQFKAALSSREGIESALKDIQLYHSPYGAEYTLNERLTAETQLPNFFGGDPLPARLEVQMTEFEPGRDYCKIVTKQQIDRQMAGAMVYDFLKKTAEQSGKPLPKEFEMPVLNVEDTSEHEVELAGGWVSRAYFKREIQSGPARQTDVYEITMQR